MPMTYTKDVFAELLSAGNHQIGDYTYGFPAIHDFRDGSKLRIGRYCSLAEPTILLGGNHRTDWGSTYPFTAVPDTWPEVQGIPGHPQSGGDVSIGNDVWLAYRCLIMGGVSVGDGAVVAAHAVVARDVPPYAIVAGNPARVVRYRFTPDIVARLLQLEWWHFPERVLHPLLPLLVSPDIDLFLEQAEKASDSHPRPAYSFNAPVQPGGGARWRP